MYVTQFKRRVSVSVKRWRTTWSKTKRDATVFFWLLPISGDLSQLEPQSLELIGETNKLCSFIAILRPVLAVLHNGPARCPLIPLAFQFTFFVAPHRFGRLFS